MKDLLEALTDLAREGSLYLRHQRGGPTVQEAPATEKKTRKKAQEPAPVAPEGSPLDPPAEPAKTEKVEKVEKPTEPAKPEMTEEQSVAELTAAGQDFVRRYPTQEEGLTAARKIMADLFKVTRSTDLTHPQRIQFAQALRAAAPAKL